MSNKKLSEAKSRLISGKSPSRGNKKILIIIAIVIVVNLGLFLFFRSQKSSQPVPASSPPPVNQPVIVDQPLVQDLPLVDQPAPATDSSSADSSAVTIGGVLIGDGNPWTLIYDDAATGAPAATLELVFNGQSRCDFGHGDVFCTPMYYEVGTGIEVTGQKDGGKLIVTHIKRAVALMGQ